MRKTNFKTKSITKNKEDGCTRIKMFNLPEFCNSKFACPNSFSLKYIIKKLLELQEEENKNIQNHRGAFPHNPLKIDRPNRW